METERIAVQRLYNDEQFAGFGLSRLSSSPQPPSLRLIQGSRPGRLKAQLRKECPRCPGVYGMVNEQGRADLCRQGQEPAGAVAELFSSPEPGSQSGADRGSDARLAWEPGTSEFAALSRELELIRRWRPRFNVQGQPARRRRVYVCVGRQPAPYVFLASRPPGTTVALFGPIPAGTKSREAVRRVNDWYRLRDCPQAQEMVFAEQPELFPVLRTPGCLRHDLGTCLGPCAAACTRRDYKVHVRNAIDFLRGQDRGPLDTLRREMAAAAAAMAFERAAVLRDKLDQLVWLDEHLDRLRQAARHSFVYPVRGHNGSELWYLIQGGRVRSIVPRPHDEPTRQHADLALTQVYQRTDDTGARPLTLEEIDGVLLVTAWFRRHHGERQRVLTPADAIALCS